MKIICISDGHDSSATHVLNQVKQHSRHELIIRHYSPQIIDLDIDIVYVHCGALLYPHSMLTSTIKSSRDVKWIGGIRGVTNLKRWVETWPPTSFCSFVYDLHGISVANQSFYNLTKTLDSRLKVHLCHSGVDPLLFQPTSFPIEFSIGWAGAALVGAKMFPNFIRLPFPKRTSADGYGTWRSFREMPKFYSIISVYVSTSVEEGSPVPPKEAAASGRPVVAVECGDLSEWIPPEYLVKDWRELIPLIRRFESDNQLLINEGKRFRELGLRWNYKAVAHEYDLMFEDVMRN